MPTPFEIAFAPYANIRYSTSSPHQPSNYLQRIATKGEDVGAGKMKDRPRIPGRLSLLNIIGGIADTFARVGGAEPLYQPMLDAREDRAREIDLDDLRRRVDEQRLRAGDIEINDAQAASERERIGMALGGLMESEDPATDWLTLAEQSGIDPQRAQAIGQVIQRNPEIVGQLATTFGFEPARAGSQAKELQVYELLRERNPELADAYLANIANGSDDSELTPYQREQIRLARERLDLQREKYENPPPTEAQRNASGNNQQAMQEASAFIDELEGALTRLNDAGGMNVRGTSAEQRVGQVLAQNIPFAERIAYPSRYSARQDIDGLLTQGVLALIPVLSSATVGGKNFDAKAEMDNLKQSLASATDYDSAIRAIHRWRERINRRLSAAETSSAAPNSRRSGGGRAQPRGTRGNPAAIAEARRRGLIP